MGITGVGRAVGSGVAHPANSKVAMVVFRNNLMTLISEKPRKSGGN
jgi:hypothetical protein